MVVDDTEKEYMQLKELLRNKGWIEQDGGENGLNGTLGTNFLKDGCIITILYNYSPDEEEVEELFGG